MSVTLQHHRSVLQVAVGEYVVRLLLRCIQSSNGATNLLEHVGIQASLAGLTAERFGLAAPIMLRAALPVVSLVIYGVTQCCCPLATAANGR